MPRYLGSVDYLPQAAHYVSDASLLDSSSGPRRQLLRRLQASALLFST